MKKARLLAFLLLACSATAEAQKMTDAELYHSDNRRRSRLRTEWSASAGVSFADYTADGSQISISPKTGYHAGFSLGLLFGKRMALIPELRFTHSAFSMTGRAGGKASIKTNSIDFPLLFEYRILAGRLRFSAGPSFTLMNKGRYTYGSHTEDGMRFRPTVTYAVGATGVIGRHLMIGVRFNGQFNRTEQIMGFSRDDADYESFRLGSRTISAGIGYKF
ncbi:MAG: PorT family protein [Alistipes sp.]|nr:PorT family protein [Alistipes sp.]